MYAVGTKVRNRIDGAEGVIEETHPYLWGGGYYVVTLPGLEEDGTQLYGVWEAEDTTEVQEAEEYK